MPKTRLNFDINFRTRGNFGPLTQGLNQVRAQSTAAFGAMTTPAIRTKSAIDGLSSSLERKRLTLTQTRVALRNTSAILKEHNALLNASAVSYKNAAGAGKTYLTINRAMTASVSTLNQRLRFTVTVLNAASTSLINFGKNVQWAGRQVMMGLTLPLMLIGTAASKAAEDLDRQLVRIVKVTNISTYKLANEFGELGASMRDAFDVGDASADMMERVSMMGDFIRKEAVRLVEFGASLGFVAEETGKVSAEFAQMGYQGYALSALTKQAATLSRISGTDLNDSVQLVRLTVQAFGNDIGDLEEKFARLNLIENNTSLSLAEMAQGIPIVASVANNLGISIENLAGMLAVMKEKGIAAREGATALRTGLIQLIQKPTRNAVEAFELINVNLNEMQERHRGDIIGFFNELAHTMDDLSGSGRQGQANLEMFTQALATLTGVRASARFLSLISEMGNLEKAFDEETGEEIWRVKEGLEENDVAARAFINTIYDSEKAIAIYRYELDQVNNSLSGIRDRLKAELNVELAKMGEAFLRVGNAVRTAINNVLRSFNSLSDRTQNIVFAFGTFIAVLGPVTMFLGIFANALGQIAKGVTALLPKMKLMTAAQVAEARAQEVTNQRMALSLAMKEELIATNMRLAASNYGLATSQAATLGVLASHGQFGVAPLPMSIRPGSSAAQQSAAATGLLTPGQRKLVAAGGAGRASDVLLQQRAQASRVAGTVAAGSLLAPNLMRMFPGADLGLMGIPLQGGTGSIAQTLQQELERDLLRTREAALRSGAIGGLDRRGRPIGGAALDAQFGRYLKSSGYSPEQRLREMALVSGQTGRIGKQAVDQGFFRAAMGMAPALAAGTIISGQAVSKLPKKIAPGTAAMATLVANERLFELAQMQRAGVSVAEQVANQTRFLEQEAMHRGITGQAAQQQYVRQNMPRTLPAPVGPRPSGAAVPAVSKVNAARQTVAQSRRFAPPVAPRQKTPFRLGGNQFPYTPSPYVDVPDGTARPERQRGPLRSGGRYRVTGFTPTDLRTIPPNVPRPPLAGVGMAMAASATRAADVAGRATGNAVKFLGNRAADVVHAAGEAAGRTADNLRRAGRVVQRRAVDAVAAASDTGTYYGQRAARRGRIIRDAAMFAGAGAMSRGRAAAFRGIEGITGRTGGLPQAVSRQQLNAATQARLAREFDDMVAAGRAPQGVTQQQYVSSGMRKQGGVKGRMAGFRSAMRGTQGAQTTHFLRGVQRGSQGAGFLTKAASAALLMPLKAPFKAIGKLGTLAGKGLQAAAKSGGILGKVLGPLAKMGLGGKAGAIAGVALGAGLKLALPLTIVFGALAMTNRDEFMKGLMSTLQGPLDRMRAAWDQLTKRFEYVMFLFRNLRGDGEGAFAGIARMVGRLAGWVGGILMDAFTSVMTAIQIIFKAVEFLLKLFSGDFRGAIDALKDAFKLFGIFVLEIFLNIADTLLGWVPLLGRVIRRGKEVVAGWRESITALDEVQQALVEVDKTVRSLRRNSDEWTEGLEEAEASVRRMSELEIFPMELVEGLLESVRGWEFDPFEDMDQQIDEVTRTIAEMEDQMGRLPPQIQDQILSYIEQVVVVEAINKLLEEQEDIKKRLLGETDNLTDEETERLNQLREETAELEAMAAVLQAIDDGQGKSEPMWGKNWTDEMKAAAEDLVEAGLIVKEAGGLFTSDVFDFSDNEHRAARARDILENYNNLVAERLELENQTSVGMERQLDTIRQQIAEQEFEIRRRRQALEYGILDAETRARYVAEIAAIEAGIVGLREEEGKINEILHNNREAARQLAANQEQAREAQRHIQTMQNLRAEAEMRLSGMTVINDEYIGLHRQIAHANRRIGEEQAKLNELRAEGVVLAGEERDIVASLMEMFTNSRREWSEAIATRRDMEDDKDPGEIGDNTESEASSVASAFRSAMSEVMSDIATSFNKVLSEQSKRISDHFSDLKNSTKDYFDEYNQRLTEQTREIIDQLEQRAQAEEDAINAVADLRIEYIEEQAAKERELDELRERFFRREQARIDYVRSRAVADINIREALLRGERGRAAILRIEKEMAAQQFYNDILKEREQDIRAMRQAAREEEIDLIEQEREEALKANKERIDIEKIAVSEAEKRAKEASKIAEERAQAEIESAEKAAEEAMELEQYRIQQYLREWQKITPATEEEFKKHLGELQKFFDQSNNRLRSEINKIYGDFSIVFNSMSKDFQNTNNSLMSELRKRLTGVENQYLDMNNTILGAIHNTNVEVANSIEDILANIGTSTTTTEKLLGDARDAFKVSVEGMLDALLISSETTLLAFTEDFIPDFTSNMDWAFGTVNDMGKDFAKVFGHDLEAGFETAMDRAIAALTEEKKWKDAEAKIAAHMANIAKHLNINIPSPGGGGGGGGGGDKTVTDPHPFPGNISQGQRGEHVRKVQKALNHFLRGFGMQQISEDGIFGPQTGSALIAVKQRTGRPAGAGWAVVDESTWNHFKHYFHSGGLVGSKSDVVPEKGLKPNEVSAVLQKGEYVINRRAVSLLGTDFLDRINSTQAKFSSPRGAYGTLRPMNGGSSTSVQNHYNLSFQIDGGNIDEQRLAQKVVFEIKKMERDMGGGRRIS